RPSHLPPPSHSHSALCLLSRASRFSAPLPTDSYTLSLHDALPISGDAHRGAVDIDHEGRARIAAQLAERQRLAIRARPSWSMSRSEEHTSELQSHLNLVCRLLLEKKKQHNTKARPELRPTGSHR